MKRRTIIGMVAVLASGARAGATAFAFGGPAHRAIDGFEVCRRLRATAQSATVPIIMLTARGEDVDRIVGLEIGADDYLGKPFIPRELLARIRAVLRRSSPPTPPEGRPLRVGSVHIPAPSSRGR
jgi:DNA-binding response OmpR family regulator